MPLAFTYVTGKASGPPRFTHKGHLDVRFSKILRSPPVTMKGRPDPVPPILSQEAPGREAGVGCGGGQERYRVFETARSAILHLDDPCLPDLAAWERQGRILFVPFGGELVPWALYLARLDLPTFGLFPTSRCRRPQKAADSGRRWSISAPHASPGSR